MDQEEKKYWLAFNVFPGIGPLRFKLLLDYFGSAQKAYNSSRDKLQETGLSDKLVSRFLEFRQKFNLDLYFLRVSQLGIETITAEDKDYPKLLKEAPAYPPVLYVKTRGLINWRRLLLKKMIAVVGTRLPTDYGEKVTVMLTQKLIARNFVIVSGLARGIDRITHQTAIASRGDTIGVLACGLDRVYPPEHRDLVERIVESGGAVISESALGAEIKKGDFPARNRIISGLSLGVVITEAAQKSGSLITASHAADQGREVLVVPGPITSPKSQGTLALIKKGARVVTDVDDIFEELGIGR